VSLPLPHSLSPSKVSAFKDCALAFRFSAIDRLPEPPSVPAVRGTLVHRALEGLFWSVPRGQRTAEAAQAQLERAWEEMQSDPEWLDLALSPEEAAGMLAEARVLVERYFGLEDPDSVVAIGTEVVMEARLGSLLLRGIIDRLDLLPDGSLVVTDYKTGKVPGVAQEQARLGGVHFYAFLCREVLGVLPARVQLLYLKDQVVLSTEPSEQSCWGLCQRVRAIWAAVERACRLEDFRPKPSALCQWCSYRAWCPAWGGDPALARVEALRMAPGRGGGGPVEGIEGVVLAAPAASAGVATGAGGDGLGAPAPGGPGVGSQPALPLDMVAPG